MGNITSALLRDARLSTQSIRGSASEGIVPLSGRVRSHRRKSARARLVPCTDSCAVRCPSPRAAAEHPPATAKPMTGREVVSNSQFFQTEKKLLTPTALAGLLRSAGTPGTDTSGAYFCQRGFGRSDGIGDYRAEDAGRLVDNPASAPLVRIRFSLLRIMVIEEFPQTVKTVATAAQIGG